MENNGWMFGFENLFKGFWKHLKAKYNCFWFWIIIADQNWLVFLFETALTKFCLTLSKNLIHNINNLSIYFVHKSWHIVLECFKRRMFWWSHLDLSTLNMKIHLFTLNCLLSLFIARKALQKNATHVYFFGCALSSNLIPYLSQKAVPRPSSKRGNVRLDVWDAFKFFSWQSHWRSKPHKTIFSHALLTCAYSQRFQ